MQTRRYCMRGNADCNGVVIVTRLSRAASMRASVCTVYLFCLAAGVSGSIFSDYCRFSQIVPARDEERPSARYGHTTVDYGTKMILFGGYDGAFR